MTRTRVLILVCSLAGAAVLLFTASAPAHFDRDSSTWYTFDVSNCEGPADEVLVDPLNVVFYNWGTSNRVTNQIEAHAGWYHGDGTDQWFRDHGNCNLMHAQRASNSQYHSRHHIRIRSQEYDATLGWAASGDAHYEDVVDCNSGYGWSPRHAVRENAQPGQGWVGSGFDMARSQLAAAFGMHGHSYYFAWRGNTRSFRQCDGQYASSDGNVAWISVHNANH